MSMRGIAAILTAAICALSFAADEKKKKRAEPASVPVRISTLHEGGARLDRLGERIAFDKQVGEYFALHGMRQDGSEVRCLSCGHPDLPHRHIGQPAWHPNGRYLVFQAEKAEHARRRFEQVLMPGAGVLNDLWALDLQTNRAAVLREVENVPGRGTLHAHFSAYNEHALFSPDG